MKSKSRYERSDKTTKRGGNQPIGRLRYKLDLENVCVEHGLSNSYEDRKRARLIIAERNLELFRSKVVYWEGQVKDLKEWLGGSIVDIESSSNEMVKIPDARSLASCLLELRQKWHEYLGSVPAGRGVTYEAYAADAIREAMQDGRLNE